MIETADRLINAYLAFQYILASQKAHTAKRYDTCVTLAVKAQELAREASQSDNNLRGLQPIINKDKLTAEHRRKIYHRARTRVSVLIRKLEGIFANEQPASTAVQPPERGLLTLGGKPQAS